MPVESIKDPTIRIEATPKLKDFISNNIINMHNVPIGISALQKKGKKDSDFLLKISDLKWLNEYLEEYRKTQNKTVYLHELLKGADVKLPTPIVTPRNPELEARVKKLKIQQEAKEYEAMTKNIDCVRRNMPEDTIAYQMKQINKQLIAVAQFVFSVIAGFAFGFIGVELLFGNLDFGFRLLLGIMCALIVALAEIYFLAIKLNEDCFDPTPSRKSKKLHQE